MFEDEIIIKKNQTFTEVTFSKCEEYRYTFKSIWNDKKSLLTFIMLNPSTANEEDDDRTVSRIRGFSNSLGYGGFIIVNLFAYRTPYPNKLYEVEDPIGKYNDHYIRETLDSNPDVIVAWGNSGGYLDRHEKIFEILESKKIKVKALKWNSSGHPAHPLYLSGDSVPTEKTP